MKRYLLLLTICLIALGGCAKAPVEKTRFFIPPLPEQPRLEWVLNYYDENSFPKTANQRAFEEVFGRPPAKKMERPYGIVSDGNGKVYVADSLSRMVKVFDMDNYGVGHFGGVNPIRFKEPYGLAMDRAGRLYVADAGAGVVKVYEADGKPVMALSNRDKFDMVRPIYLAINDELGRVYVSDARKQKIYVFSTTGEPLFSFGGIGTEVGDLYAPQGMAIDRDGKVYVAELFNTRIQVFDADGKVLDSFGVRGDQIHQFEGPKDLAFDSDGNLHIVDVRKAAHMVYRPDGRILLFVGGRPSQRAMGHLMPVSISVDRNDEVFISDSMNRRISRWQYFSEDYIMAHPDEFEGAGR